MRSIRSIWLIFSFLIMGERSQANQCIVIIKKIQTARALNVSIDNIEIRERFKVQIDDKPVEGTLVSVPQELGYAYHQFYFDGPDGKSRIYDLLLKEGRIEEIASNKSNLNDLKSVTKFSRNELEGTPEEGPYPVHDVEYTERYDLLVEKDAEPSIFKETVCKQFKKSPASIVNILSNPTFRRMAHTLDSKDWVNTIHIASCIGGLIAAGVITEKTLLDYYESRKQVRKDPNPLNKFDKLWYFHGSNALFTAPASVAITQCLATGNASLKQRLAGHFIVPFLINITDNVIAPAYTNASPIDFMDVGYGMAAALITSPTALIAHAENKLMNRYVTMSLTSLCR